jgi:hypothetical protein
MPGYRTRSPRTGGRLGTFAGVFTPSVLTILGIILFLRLGFVVGSAGLGRALLIIGLANLISVLTSFSLATIATNLRVKGGGDYYLISRTLGVEFGGALGVVLFLAQSISIAFYTTGFGEAIGAVVGSGPGWLPQTVAAGAVVGLFVLAWVGADAATRFQYVVMTVLAGAIVAFFAGGLPSFDGQLLRANWTPGGGHSFWLVFAIFFPAVTGFTQGVSMSGDLRDPARSLPLGRSSSREPCPGPSSSATTARCGESPFFLGWSTPASSRPRSRPRWPRSWAPHAFCNRWRATACSPGCSRSRRATGRRRIPGAASSWRSASRCVRSRSETST